MTFAIELTGLHKIFGHGKKAIHAVNDLSLTIEAGQVYGFLGPNGAGKSTTIRMILGLSACTDGNIKLFGTPLSEAKDLLRQRVGALVEGANLYPHLTGRQNLEVMAKTSGVFDRQRIAEVIDIVDMKKQADYKAKNYSTGMKQRIGIAAALINNPDLVILDEPTNGLDPRGIQEIRLLIRQLADIHQKTILLSSHLLHEIEQVCDRVAIINNGRMIQEGTINDLLEGTSYLIVDAAPIEKAIAILQPHFALISEDSHLKIITSPDTAPQIVRMLTQANIDVYQVVTKKPSLEDYFLAATEKTL
ncbi:ABC transporter ATP-binding protein [Phototrophicus methaneseepsis]|uniref:ABC transporter ATP-binding protein n=1 Tax=Phototrophicus methaneseepsis TaxID=2710758 RepID=A0A7S8ED87_9CHLR|nr:ABC transporter ATP-binding protein [Phototrophicus methaneseepsis]QPC84832.1 ABC transporter ATP-binding protein [Phototrophicus methaneseepsis]